MIPPEVGAMTQPTPDDLTRRVQELEQELERLRSERDEYRSALYELADELAPFDPNWQPPTPEDTVNARSLLAELERKYLGGTA